MTKRRKPIVRVANSDKVIILDQDLKDQKYLLTEKDLKKAVGIETPIRTREFCLHCGQVKKEVPK